MYVREWKCNTPFLNLGTRWRRLVCFTTWPLYTQEGPTANGTEGWMDPIADLGTCRRDMVISSLTT